MTDQPNSVPQLITIERKILCSLCSAQISSSQRNTFLGALASHRWKEPEHRVVYETLGRIRPSSPAAIRQELPAAATRMGFPDVDWNSYFESIEDPSTCKLEALVEELSAAAAPGSPRP